MPGLVPDITFFVPVVGVDGRVKPGHDVERTIARKNSKHPARRKRLADVLHLGPRPRPWSSMTVVRPSAAKSLSLAPISA
jgi:hypothetical protein